MRTCFESSLFVQEQRDWAQTAVRRSEAEVVNPILEMEGSDNGYSTGLENQRPQGLVSSNLTPSAKNKSLCTLCRVIYFVWARFELGKGVGETGVSPCLRRQACRKIGPVGFSQGT